MNTETDRDLTTEEQEQLSGGLFFRDDLPGEFADQFLQDPAAILSWPLSGEIWALGGQKRPRNPHDVIG